MFLSSQALQRWRQNFSPKPWHPRMRFNGKVPTRKATFSAFWTCPVFAHGWYGVVGGYVIDSLLYSFTNYH